MAVIGIMTVAVLYSVLKLTKWSLNADEPPVRVGHIDRVSSLYRTALMFVLLLEFGPGIADWLRGAFNLIMSVIL